MSRASRSCSLLVALALAAAALRGQAFCALRDPVHHIRSLYPAATTWRSNVTDVDQQVRDRIADRLPFTLHRRELGRHTIYSVGGEHGLLGIVHARSESSPWGMVELVWSLDGALRVTGMRFQRCRSPEQRAFEASRLCRRIGEGLDFDELRAMLDDDGEHLTADVAADAVGCEVLGALVVRSALKTVLCTELAWGRELAPTMVAGCAAEFAPDCRLGAMRVLTSPADPVRDEEPVVREAMVADVFEVRGEPRRIGAVYWLELERDGDFARTCVFVAENGEIRHAGRRGSRLLAGEADPLGIAAVVARLQGAEGR